MSFLRRPFMGFILGTGAGVVGAVGVWMAFAANGPQPLLAIISGVLLAYSFFEYRVWSRGRRK